MRKALFLLGLALLGVSCISEKNEKHYKMELHKIPLSAKFEDSSWYIWGGSVVERDGVYHMFYSRWPKKFHFSAWLTHSEVAHAVSNSPFGPFKHKNVALSTRDSSFWDADNIHNPTVKEFDGKYYLYYTGNKGDRVVSHEGNYNWLHRNNQRIGVAVAEHPDGPWKRFNRPLLELPKEIDAPDALMMANPSVARNSEGKYVLVYKCVGRKGKLPSGGPVVHMVAFADSPTGPFVRHPVPIFTIEGDDFPAEDPFIWSQGDKLFAIVKDFNGVFTDHGRSLALFESTDGIDWNLSKNKLVATRTIQWEDGRVQSLEHLERPQLFIENGIPKALMCAADSLNIDGILQSFNLQIPVSFN